MGDTRYIVNQVAAEEIDVCFIEFLEQLPFGFWRSVFDGNALVLIVFEVVPAFPAEKRVSTMAIKPCLPA